MNTLRILLAEGNPKVRSALRLLLEQEPGLQVAGEARDIQELLRLLLDGSFDIILLDWEFSNVRAAHLLAMMRSLCPGARVVAISGRVNAKTESLVAGAEAFISKGDSPDVLLSLLRGWREEVHKP